MKHIPTWMITAAFAALPAFAAPHATSAQYLMNDMQAEARLAVTDAHFSAPLNATSADWECSPPT